MKINYITKMYTELVIERILYFKFTLLKHVFTQRKYKNNIKNKYKKFFNFIQFYFSQFPACFYALSEYKSVFTLKQSSIIYSKQFFGRAGCLI